VVEKTRSQRFIDDLSIVYRSLRITIDSECESDEEVLGVLRCVDAVLDDLVRASVVLDFGDNPKKKNVA